MMGSEGNFQLWYPKFKKDESGQKEDPSLIQKIGNITIESAKKTYNLFTDSDEELPLCNGYKYISDMAFSERMKESLLSILSKSESLKPIPIYGIFPYKKAKELSWKEWGLNLFDLPWDDDKPENKKLLRYINITSLVDLVDLIEFNQSDPYSKDYITKIIDDLKWVECHIWISSICSKFGHKERDDMQICEKKDIKTKLEGIIKSAPRLCENCHVIRILRQSLKELEIKSSDEIFEPLKEVANCDCQVHNLAAFINKGPLHEALDLIPYRTVFVFEDDPQMRKHVIDSYFNYIKEEISDVYKDDSDEHDIKIKYNDECIHILSPDPGASIKNLSFSKSDEILIEEHENWIDNCKTLYCFDLKLLSGGTEKNIHGISPGLWFLYKTALEKPSASRLVITGYRAEDEKAFNAGACSFLLKPFSDKEFKQAVENAGPYKILWICPPYVRNEWEEDIKRVDDIYNWKDFEKSIITWFRSHNIRLEFIKNFDLAKAQMSDLVILDRYPIENKKLVSNVTKIQNLAPKTGILILLPMTNDVFKHVGILHSLGKILRDGQDAILHKPLWFIPDIDCKIKGVPNLFKTVIDILSKRPKYDVKYVALTPLMGLILARAKKEVLNMLTEQPSNLEEPNRTLLACSPFILLIGMLKGFEITLEYALKDEELERNLRDALKKDIDNNSKSERWKFRCGYTTDQIINAFLPKLKDCSDKSITQQTLKTWLTKVLEYDIETGKARNSFSKDLALLFGGQTKYHFEARGGWFDKEKYIEDVPLVLEFCGRRGIIARDAIRNVVVKYLTKEGGEQVVLFQEIPIRGYMEGWDS